MLQLHVNRITTFTDGHLKILKIWLKMPILAHKFTFWLVLTPNNIFSHRNPIRHFLARNRVICTLVTLDWVKIGSAIFAVGDDKNKKGKEMNGKGGKERYKKLYFMYL